MIDIAKNRTLSLFGMSAALSTALVLLFIVCAVAQAVVPGLRIAHAWIGLFTSAPLTSPQAWAEGLFFSLLVGIVVGGIVAAVHNAVAARGL